MSHRIEPGFASNLGAQLPEEVGRHLTTVDTVDRFDWEEFQARLAADEAFASAEPPDIVHQSRVVMDVIDDAIEGAVIEELRDQLPANEDWNELFELVDQSDQSVAGEQRPD